MIEVEMPDGTILEFPSGTPQDVMVQQAQQYMQRTMSPGERARAARAGTLEMLPGSAERTEAANLLAMEQMQPEPSVLADVARAIPAGLARGVTGAMDLPGAIVSGAGNLVAGGLERAGLVGPTFAEGIRQSMSFTPMGTGSTAREGVEMLSGGASEYQAQTTPGKFAQTTSEFLPGGLAGPARGMATRALQYGVLPGLASEAAGQLTEGTAAEPYARAAGAFFAPVALSTGNRTVNAFMDRASKAPSVGTLKDAKTAAYKAVDDAGVTFTGQQTVELSDRIKSVLAQSDFVPDVDAQTRAALEVINRNAGVPLTLGQLDKIRQGLWKRYNAAPNEVAILDMIDEVDTLVDSMQSATPLMEAARLANSRFKKAELIENAFKKAADQTAATGSGGNIVNKYRQAITSIINNPKQARFFSNEEIAMMRNFVRGNNAENALRLVGKLSPSGSGLMMALNVGAIAANPYMAILTATGAGSKYASEAMAMTGARRMQDALATGVIPTQSAGTVLPGIARTIPGLLAQ